MCIYVSLPIFMQEQTSEPSDFCQMCDSYLPLSQLRKHVTICKEKQEQESLSYEDESRYVCIVNDICWISAYAQKLSINDEVLYHLVVPFLFFT